MTLLSISGTLIVALLGIIGFFLKRQISVIEALTESVNSLKTSIEVLRNNEANLRLNCGLMHGHIDKRLDAHSARLDTHESSIATLEERSKPRTRTRK